MNRIWGFLVVIVMIPGAAIAQECSEDDQFELEICIEDAKFACLDQYPQCDEEEEDSSDLASGITDNISESCCAKTSKTKRLLCLNAAMASLKRTGKQILPFGLANQVRSGLKEILSEVKSSGECFEEDEDEDEEEDDEDDEFEDEF